MSRPVLALQSPNSFCKAVSQSAVASTPILRKKALPVAANNKESVEESSPKVDGLNLLASSKTAKENEKNIVGSRIPIKVSNATLSKSINKRKVFSPLISTKTSSKKVCKSRMLSNISLECSFGDDIKEFLDKSTSLGKNVTRTKFKEKINNVNKHRETKTTNHDGNKHVNGQQPLHSVNNKTGMEKNPKENGIPASGISNKLKNVVSAETNISNDATNLDNHGNFENASSRLSSKPSFMKRKLYSAVSDFTDNDSVKTGESSFLEKKNVVNIYNPPKKNSDLRTNLLQGIVNLNKNETSANIANANAYSLRKTNKNSKHYFGDELPEIANVYKTATKEDVNKLVGDLLNGINFNPIADESAKSKNAEDAVDKVDSVDLNESDSMFLHGDDCDSKKTSKKQPVKRKAPTKSQNKKVISKRSRNTKVNVKQKQNVSNVEKKKQKLNKTREVSIRKNKNDAKSSAGKNSTRKKRTVNKKMNESTESNMIKNENHRKHPKIIKKMKKYSPETKERYTKNKPSSNKIYNKDIRQCKVVLPRNKDMFSNKPNSKYKYNHRIHENDFNNSYDSSSNYGYTSHGKYDDKIVSNLNKKYGSIEYYKESNFENSNQMVPYTGSKYKRENNRNFTTSMICKFPQNLQSKQQKLVVDDDFESFYEKYYPKPSLNEHPQNASLSSFNLSRFYSRVKPGDPLYRDASIYLSNQLYEEACKKPQLSTIKMYSKTKITVNQNCDDVFKMPINVPKKRKLCHQLPKCIEEDEDTSIRDDVSTASGFSSNSHNFLKKINPSSVSHENFSHDYDNRSICSFVKKATLNGLHNMMSNSKNPNRLNGPIHNSVYSVKDDRVCTSRSKNYDNALEAQSFFSNRSNSIMQNRIQDKVLYNNKPVENHLNEHSSRSVNKSLNFENAQDSFKIPSRKGVTDSPILLKHKQFRERSRLLSSTNSLDVCATTLSKPSTSNCIISENIPVASYENVQSYVENVVETPEKENCPKLDDFPTNSQKSNDSWITVKRPMIPLSPWRYTSSFD